MVPSYANLFMANLEKDLMATNSTKSNVWQQYIKDIFTIWEHGQESLDLFVPQINLFHTTIKFTAEISTECITFLDTTVLLEDGMLHTGLYTKPTNIHQYLSPNSCHPKHCTTTIPYSLGLRLRRICSRTEDFERISNERLKDKFSRPPNPESSPHTPHTSPTTPPMATTTTPCTPGDTTPNSPA